MQLNDSTENWGCHLQNNIEHNNEKIRKLEELLRSVGPDVTPSPDFKQRLLGQLVGEIKARGDNSDFTPGRNRRLTMVLRISMAAACLIFATGFYFLLVGNIPDASAEFAEMLKRVRKIKNVSFVLKCTLPGEPQAQGHVYMKHPGKARVVWLDGRIHIFNASEPKSLTLRPHMKKATFISSSGGTNYSEPLKKLRQAKTLRVSFSVQRCWKGKWLMFTR